MKLLPGTAAYFERSICKAKVILMKTFSLMSAFLLALAVTPGHANAADAKVDCLLFSKKPDGSWFVNAQTTIELGDSQITIAPGDLGPRMMQFGMADLHTVLENACPDKKGKPAPQIPNRD